MRHTLIRQEPSPLPPQSQSLDRLSWPELLVLSSVGSFAGLSMTLLLMVCLPPATRRALGYPVEWGSVWSITPLVGDLASIMIQSMLALFGGLISGITQRLVMVPRRSRSMPWLLGSAAGWVVGWPIALSIAVVLYTHLAGDTAPLSRGLALVSLASGMGGAIAGTIQGRIIWTTVAERLRWALASALGWGLVATLLVLWLAW